MTGPGTNTYLIGERAVVVVDPGPDVAEHVAATLAAADATGGHVVALLVTHGHADHLPAAYRIKEQTGAPILGHRQIPDLDRALADGETVSLGGETITSYETPGHAEDHLCFWLGADRMLFAGDLVAGLGTVVLSDAPGALTRYLASLERMGSLAPLTILPGHGPVVPDGLAKIQEYREHRAMRERQIVAALRAGPATVDLLVEQLYADTPPQLHAMAARNVRVHLDHLSAQGRALAVDGAWCLLFRQ
jgi:glyoxylase-like metal-dependent hydrolase (beta-lactamase superfamily II)